MLATERMYAALSAETAAFAATFPRADPDASVPTCPDWTYAKLAEHVGRAHRWAAWMVGTRASTYLPLADTPDGSLPADPAGRPAWLVGGAGALVRAVRDAGPDAAVWTFLPDRTAGRWIRRMLHETTVHRADLSLGVGDRYDLATDLAADGITELLGLLAEPALRFANPAAADLRGSGETLRLHGTDTGDWLLRREPDGLTVRCGPGRADVAVRGPARDLLLMLTRRLPPARTDAEMVGDPAALDRWLSLMTL
jgi:uncharacterized protein (TIGR03083 family)